MNFVTILELAKNGDAEAIEVMLHHYRPLLTKYSFVIDRSDEDLYQELCMILLHCIRQFAVFYIGNEVVGSDTKTI